MGGVWSWKGIASGAVRGTAQLALLTVGAFHASCVSAADQVPSGTLTGGPALQLLAVQNHERQLVGAAPLAWDPNLAIAAASYGPALAKLRRAIHSPKESRPGQRENIAMASHGTRTPEQLAGMWIAEKPLAIGGMFPRISSTGNWMDVGHYSQMIWPTTTRVGCAFYEADYDYLICRYSPPGNVEGHPLFANQPPDEPVGRGERGR